MGEITIDDLLAEIAPRESVARVLLRQELVAKHKELDRQLTAAIEADARENRHAEAPAIAAAIVALETEMDAHRRPFTFRGIGHRKWADLMAQHPPTREQKRDNPRVDHNPETFPVAAIAASCVDVAGAGPPTEEQVRRLEAELDVSQWSLLWGACLDANMGEAATPKSVVAGAIARANAALEAPRSSYEHLDQSSSAA